MSRNPWKRTCRSPGGKSVGVPTLGPGVDSRQVHVAFMVDKMTVGQVSLRVLRPFCTCVFTSVLHTLSFISVICHLRFIFWATDSIDNTKYAECPGGNVPDFGRMFLTLKYTDLTRNTYIRSWTVKEIMAGEKCGLLAVPRTVPVSCIVTLTLRMSVLQSHSQVKRIPTSLSTNFTVTVNCISIQLDIHVPCKVLGTLRTTTTLLRVYVV